MKLILDSNIVLRAMAAPEMLSAPARDAVKDRSNSALVSVATIYELDYKQKIGKLGVVLPAFWLQEIGVFGISWLAIDHRHAAVAANLPLHHRDPWDRIIVAQAIVEGCTLVSSDLRLAQYGVETIW